MVYECIRQCDRYELLYEEIDFDHRQVSTDFDFYVFNYHDLTSMAWLDTESVRALPGIKMTLVLEVAPNDPFVRVSSSDFDAYVVLDPTVASSNARVHAFPRPLEPPPPDLPAPPAGRPVIGTFGLPTPGKGFHRLIEAVNDEFDDALVRFNIPVGDHTPDASSVEATIRNLQSSAKPGVEVVVTRDFMSKPDLIRWCARNSLNAFLYERAMPGLAAATDQALSSGRPIAVSANDTFRHLHSYVKPYPFRSLRESIRFSGPEVARMQADWSQAAFARTFETLLSREIRAQHSPRRPGHVLLRPKTRLDRWRKQLSVDNLVPPIVSQVARKTRARLTPKPSTPTPKSPVAFASPLLGSFSAHGEDLWVDLLLGSKSLGHYVELGAQDFRRNNHTYRFYRRGWSGLLIATAPETREQLARNRPRDVVLSIAPDAQRNRSLWDDLAANAAQPIDFMSLDLSAYGPTILSGNDWSMCRPAVLLVTLTQARDEIVWKLQRHDFGLMINNEFVGVFVDMANKTEATWSRPAEIAVLDAKGTLQRGA